MLNWYIFLVECFVKMYWLYDVDATKNTFSALIAIHCDWRDFRLTWTEDEYKWKSIQVRPDFLWFPILEFNGIQFPKIVKPEFVTVFNDGRIDLVRYYF